MVLGWTKKINILQNITAFHRDNDLKSKFVKGKKLTPRKSMQKKIKAKKSWPEIGLFWGHPVIQAVEARMLEPFNKIFIFLLNLSPLTPPPRGLFVWKKARPVLEG